jgi:phage terminase large subunit
MSDVVHAYRSYQREIRDARQRGCNRFCCVFHRRGGKDRTFLGFTAEEMLKRKGTYFHILPSLNQARRDVWDNMGDDGVRFRDIIGPKRLVANYNETEMQITYKMGSIWQLMGADDERAIARLRGPNPVGLVFSEFGDMLIDAWDTLSPVLAENGGWAAFIYTPPKKLPACCVKGDPRENRCRGNHAKHLYTFARGNPSWFCSLKTVDDTRRDADGESGGPVITPEVIAEELVEKGQRHVNREFKCNFDTPVEGSYYGELITQAEKDGRIGFVPTALASPVHLAWDLGSRAITMAVGAFQLVGQEIRWINAWSEVGRGIPTYVHEIREGNRYTFGRVFVPHDARTHEIGSGKTRVEVLRGLGFRDITVVQKLGPSDGISTAQRLFPRMWFNQATCQPMLNALKVYHEESGHPVHDDSSHYADMFRYACVGIKEPRASDYAYGTRQREALTAHDPFARGPANQRYANSRTANNG